ncbi:transcription initiation factor TFIID subunit 4, partial [Striga asiatica]
MLLAVEGGGFFSSSASGYSKGLTLLLLGQKNEEKPMRVAPWTQYQLVDQETDPDIQLAPGKNCLVSGCFGRASSITGTDDSCPKKVGPSQNQEVQRGPQKFDDDDGNRKIGISRKSSLKKSVDFADAIVDGRGFGISGEGDNDVSCQIERRKVQWTDASGGELFEIREFETSEDGSDDEFDLENGKTCACRIMQNLGHLLARLLEDGKTNLRG